MKDTATRKTIVKQSKEFKPISDVGLKSAVILSKKKPQNKESFIPKTLHKYTHLPSLRYGVTPTQTNFCSQRAGPLRLTYGHENTFSKGNTNNEHVSCRNQTSYNSGSCNNEKQNTSATRRVHFAELPPKSNSSTDLKSFDGKRLSRGKRREGVENLMRNRIGIFCADGGSDSVSSSQFMRHGLLHSTATDFLLTTVKNNDFKLGRNEEYRVKRNHGFLHLQDWLKGHGCGRHRRETVNPNSSSRLPPILKAAKNGDDEEVTEILKKVSVFGIPPEELNATDGSGRTALSYVASHGSLKCLKSLLKLPKIDVNKADNEGNTPLHFASQAGQVEAINYMLSICPNIEIDAKNNLGFTPLMKAALQGRTKCAKLLLLAGASPNMRDSGRGLKAEEWAKFCGRYSCAEMIEKLVEQIPMENNSLMHKWDSEPDLVKNNPVKSASNTSLNLKSKIQKAFRTTSHSDSNANGKSFSVISQLTTVALCASSPVLQSSLSPSIKSLIRPLSVPKLEVTFASNHTNDENNFALRHSSSDKFIKSIYVSSEKK